MATTYKYEPSEEIRKRQEALNAHLQGKPGEYQSQYQQQLDEILGKIQNREPFHYDLNGDALYQQYKDRAVSQGKLAMQDTVGQVSALTGGYGNSYAQTAGQQTFQGYLQGLNDKVPELYQLALDKHNMDTADLYKQYGLLGDREAQDYGRYQDGVNNWHSDRNFLYGQYRDELADEYGKYRDQVADDKWQQEFDENNRRYNQQYEDSRPGGSGGGSGSGSGGGSRGGYDNQGYSTEEIKALQGVLGVTQDGKWGPESMAALAKAGYTAVEDVINALKLNKQPENRQPGNDGLEIKWGPGIDATRGNAGVSGQVSPSRWDTVKQRMNSFLGNGGSDAALNYMESIIGQLNEQQYYELVAMIERADKS